MQKFLKTVNGTFFRNLLFFLILYLANNTHYITVDNRKKNKNGKERQITIKPGSYTIGWDYKLQKHGIRFTLLYLQIQDSR